MSPMRPKTTERLIPASWYAITAHPMAMMSAPSVVASVGNATMKMRVAKPVMNWPIIALARRRRSVAGAGVVIGDTPLYALPPAGHDHAPDVGPVDARACRLGRQWTASPGKARRGRAISVLRTRSDLRPWRLRHVSGPPGLPHARAVPASPRAAAPERPWHAGCLDLDGSFRTATGGARRRAREGPRARLRLVGRRRLWTAARREVGLDVPVAPIVTTRLRSLEDHAALLRRMGALLAASVATEGAELERLLVRVARLAVPLLGDLCAID